VGSILYELLRGGRGKVPVYLFLDEADQYASSIIHSALNLSRQFGVNLVVMVKQISDLDARYKDQVGAFLNTPWKLRIGPTDCIRTREFFEKLAGTKTVRCENPSLGEGDKEGSTGFPEHGVPLKAGYEMGLLQPDDCILKVDGLGLIECKRKNYWELADLVDENGKPIFDPDPYEN
jgi:hypothetical protein